MDYHPTRILEHTAAVNPRVQQMWDEIRGDAELRDISSFKDAFADLLDKTMPYKEVAEQRAVDEFFKERLKGIDKRKSIYTNPDIVLYALWMKAPFQIIADFLIEQLEDYHYSALITDPRYQLMCQIENTLHSPQHYEALNTDRVLRHAIKTYCLCGKKLYIVSPGLATQMRYMELRNMPEEFLHAPYPAFYLTCPQEHPFKIYNNETGLHFVEGMYIMEDTSTTPRAWRMILTAGPNENSVHIADDSIYHYLILLAPGKTLEECITYSMEEACKSGGLTRLSEKAEIKSQQLEGSVLEIFEKSRSELIAAFKYAVNVVLYATHPDAEQEIFNSSPEFRALYKRASKATGKKRKDLFARARSVKGESHILLGKSVVISREEKDALTAPKRKGTKHSVRTYVAAHWQHYWTGPQEGERKRVYMLKKAYWKGASTLPVSTSSRVVK